MNVRLGYPLCDADQHYYEPPDAFVRFIDPSHRDKAIRVAPDASGVARVWIGDRMYDYAHPYVDEVPRPGAMTDMYRQVKRGDFKGAAAVVDVASARNEVIPIEAAMVNREARLAKMDEHGVEACLLHPSLAVAVEHHLDDDPEAAVLNMRAFNRWLYDDWGFSYRNRIFGVPLISLLDVDAAVQELEWVIKHGARFIELKMGPVGRRSPADPVFDPFWARVNDAGIGVIYHIGESGYHAWLTSRWSEPPYPTIDTTSALQTFMGLGDRPIMDTIAALIFHNLFGRFPNVRILSIENGSQWVPYFLKALDKAHLAGRKGHWLCGPITDRPSVLFKRHVFVAPYPEEDKVALVRLIGADRVLFGSDWPHPEGLAEPIEFATDLGDLTPEEVRLIMRDNFRRLAGLSV